MEDNQDSNFIETLLEATVKVKLTNGLEYRGTLNCLDQNMNINLVSAKEFDNNVETDAFSSLFIRGNNVLLIEKSN